MKLYKFYQKKNEFIKKSFWDHTVNFQSNSASFCLCDTENSSSVLFRLNQTFYLKI